MSDWKRLKEMTADEFQKFCGGPGNGRCSERGIYGCPLLVKSTYECMWHVQRIKHGVGNPLVDIENKVVLWS